MSCYVDQPIFPFGRMMMCHLWADSLDELLAMVDLIGVDRKWIQGHPDLSFGKHRNASWVHFDISKGKRDLAVAAGAIETDRYGPIEWLAKRDLNSGNPVRVIRAHQHLARIEGARAVREASHA